jgi:hypothetical protein
VAGKPRRYIIRTQLVVVRPAASSVFSIERLISTKYLLHLTAPLAHPNAHRSFTLHLLHWIMLREYHLSLALSLLERRA